MVERRKVKIGIPLFSTFNIIFLIVIIFLLLSVTFVYYSFEKKLQQLSSSKGGGYLSKIPRFLELPHGQLEELGKKILLEQVEQDKTYYSIISKIFSKGAEFRRECFDSAIEGDNILFTAPDNKLHLGVFKFNVLGVVAYTTHFFTIPLQKADKKVFSRLISVNNKNQPIIIHFFESPSFKIEPEASNIKFCGVFYRVVEYENREGKIITAPLFLTYTVDKYSFSKTPRSPFISLIVLLAAIIIIITFYIRHKLKMKKLYLEKLELHNKKER